MQRPVQPVPRPRRRDQDHQRLDPGGVHRRPDLLDATTLEAPTARPYATSTCAHEFGHVKSLRHAHTNALPVWYIGPGAPVQTLLVDPNNNNQPLDHDSKDAFACLMSYTRPINAEPCGFCALSMRFYDRVEIQKAEPLP